MGRSLTILLKSLGASVVVLLLALPASPSIAAGFTVTIQPNSSWCTPTPNGAFTVGNNDPPYFSFRCLGGFELRGDPSGSATAGQQVWAQIDAPAGITITGGSAVGSIQNFGTGWVEDAFYAGGSTQSFIGTNPAIPAFASPYWGLQLYCASTCSGAGQIALSSIVLGATESQGPSLTAVGAGNLWYQTRPSEWVWNPPGDPWPMTLAGSDPTGVCSMSASIAGNRINGPATVPNTSQWQQCPDPNWTPDEGASVDTRDFVDGAGSLPLTLNATNAAGVLTSYSERLDVDDDPVSLSLTTANGVNPTVWVNHPVTVDATATAGPSEIGGTNCNVDGTARGYDSQGVTVDGDGIHTVTCTAWNNAVGPQGQPNTATSSLQVHIDEAPPTVSFESRNPHDLTALTVDATDSESGVASESIEMAPAGTNNWTVLPSTFNGAQLATHFDDSQHTGPYQFRATACDNVANCASTTEQLTLPVRMASDQEVSLTRIVNPIRQRVILKRVLVGWHWATLRRGNQAVRVKRGGHFKTIKVIEYIETCTTERVKTGPHTWQRRRACAPPHTRVTTTLREAYGHSVTIHGVYTTVQGVPVANQLVHILAAPDNGLSDFGEVATATTASDGSWTATLPPGPSRIIRASTDGTGTILPSTGQVTALVPAPIKLLRVWPRHVAWGGTVHLIGQLLGGYLPPGGALVRLRIGYRSTYNTYGVEEHVTGDGRFSTVASFGPGDPSVVRTYWFQIASLPMGDYPYSPAASQRVPVIVGGNPG